MNLKAIRKILVTGSIGLMLLLLGSEANAQNRRDFERERQRIERENERFDRQRRNRRVNQRNVSPRVERQINNSNFMSGYHYGFMAGEYDRRRGKYNQSNVYRNTGAYPNAGDPSSSDYIYRQGYLEGYNDGFYGRRRY